MIKIAIEAIHDVIAGIASDDDILDNEAVGDADLLNVHKAMTENEDEAFVRLALEQALKDNQPKDYARFSTRFEEELEPVFRDLYEKLWGHYPMDPVPNIEYIRVWERQKGVVSSYQRDDWFKLRAELYGPPPYDYETLRQSALVQD